MKAFDVPTLPEHSIVTVDEHDDGLRFAWPLWPSYWSRRFIICLCAINLPIFWTMAIALIIAFLLGHRYLFELVAIPMIMGLTRVTRHFFQLIRPTHPESVLLSSESITYDPGCFPRPNMSKVKPDPPVLGLPKRPALAMRRNEIRNCLLDRSTKRTRLILEIDEETIEVGEVLNDAEITYLFAILQRWLRGDTMSLDSLAMAGAEKATYQGTS
jgi:hypothetical protein